MKEDVTLVEQTQRDILKYISQNGNSSRLPKEQEFVELLGVSRVVVREALSRLRAVGIIETLRDLYQLRLMLEIGMADFIYMNRTDAQMEELDRIVAEEVSLSNEMATADDMDQRYAIAKKLTDVDVRFHSKLFEMTGNKSLIDFQYILRHLFTLYYPKIRTDYHSRTLVSHVSLYNILRTSTPDAFRMGMRLHLKTQFDNMESILEKTFNNK